MNLPKIIQGGMGAGVSSWQLARSVCSRGQLGVVSGTALDVIMARRLQVGDLGGHVRRALEAFPDQSISRRLIDRYFVAGGKAKDQPFAPKPMVGHKYSKHIQELLVASNFVEVFLAKEGHDGVVGMNYLHKIQTTLLPSIYGAMLAGVTVFVVGAGIPFDIPGIIDGLVKSEPVELSLHVKDATPGVKHKITFDPKDVFENPPTSLPRPDFYPIVSSVTLASLLVKKGKGRVNGLIVEAPTAGGHNAPPRGRGELSAKGEPVYGERDEVDLEKIKSHGIPFYLAGSYGTPGKLAEALAAGAAGIQVGTLFAFCEESGLSADIRRDVVKRCQTESLHVFTDPIASPTGFPFKVLTIDDTLSNPEVYANRNRKCDLGYLREAYERPNGTLGWRCSSEEVDIFLHKGGALEETVGRKCLCNGLLANIDLAQYRNGSGEELPLVTCGDEVASILKVLRPGESSYSSSDVIDYLLADVEA